MGGLTVPVKVTSTDASADVTLNLVETLEQKSFANLQTGTFVDVEFPVSRAGVYTVKGSATDSKGTSQQVTAPNTGNFFMCPSFIGWVTDWISSSPLTLIRVTNLNDSGAGSLRDALSGTDRKMVVFDVSGRIHLQSPLYVGSNTFIAGQTAPQGGVLVTGERTIINNAQNVVVMHMEFRAGQGTHGNGFDPDSLGIEASSNVLIEHCSMSWGIDENLAVAGPYFSGSNVNEWRANTSHNVTISHCLVSEPLVDSTDPHGAQGFGMLVTQNVRGLLLYNNLFISNRKRNPEIKQGTQVCMINNFFYDAQKENTLVVWVESEWGDAVVQSEFSAEGNYYLSGPNTNESDPGYSGIQFNHSRVDAYLDDNVLELRNGSKITSGSSLYKETNGAQVNYLGNRPFTMPAEVPVKRKANDVRAYLEKWAGSRPYDRNQTDIRVLGLLANDNPSRIDHENDVGGYPNPSQVTEAYLEKYHSTCITTTPASGTYYQSTVEKQYDWWSQAADVVVTSAAEFEAAIADASKKVIEVAPGDYSGSTSGWNVQGGTAASPKIIRPQVTDTSGLGPAWRHPYKLSASQRVILPKGVKGQMSSSNYVVTGCVVSGDWDFVIGEDGVIVENVVLDRLMSINNGTNYGDIGVTGDGCNNVWLQNLYFERNSDYGESVSVYVGRHQGGGVYRNVAIANVEGLDVNDLTQLHHGTGAQHSAPGMRIQNVWLHYSSDRRTDNQGNIVGASGTHQLYEGQVLDMKFCSEEPANPIVVEDFGIVGARQCAQEAPASVSGGRDSRNTGVVWTRHSSNEMHNVTMRRYTAIDCNYNAMFYGDGSSPGYANVHLSDFTGYQCGVFATDSAESWRNDYEGLFIFKAFKSDCSLSNLRLIDNATAGCYVDMAYNAITATGVVHNGDSATEAGSDRVVFPHPITNPTATTTIPKGNA